MSEEKEIAFVAKYYRKGSFSVDNAWATLGIGATKGRRGLKAAAAVAAIVFMSATAAVIYNHYESEAAEPAAVTISEPQPLTEVVRVIDFEEAPLTVVVDKIKEVYGVEITGLPDNADSYELSLRYEGNVEDLLQTINELLETNLTIK